MEEMAPAEETVPLMERVVAWSVAELRHLLGCIAFAKPLQAWHYRFWSRWRRVHQAIARAFHYRRRLAKMAKIQL
jgi:hypothetical protein